MASTFPICSACWIASNIKQFEIVAPRIARKPRAGQFVIVRLHDYGERIPLTIADADPETGTITLIVQGVGKTTRLMNSLEAGDQILDIVGPLGNPSRIQQYGTVVVIGGGVGTAIAYPTAKAMHKAGNHVISIIGARHKDLLILEQEMRGVSDELFVTTDDGSYGTKGVVTDRLRELIDGQRIDFVLAIGPIPLMRSVAEMTHPRAIPTAVSLNSIMIDGTGMCGGCRVLLNGEARFACVDGPEFDAHQVDFDVLQRRNAMYQAAELQASQQFEQRPEIDLDRVREACKLAKRHPELRMLRAERP